MNGAGLCFSDQLFDLAFILGLLRCNCVLIGKSVIWLRYLGLLGLYVGKLIGFCSVWVTVIDLKSV